MIVAQTWLFGGGGMVWATRKNQYCNFQNGGRAIIKWGLACNTGLGWLNKFGWRERFCNLLESCWVSIGKILLETTLLTQATRASPAAPALILLLPSPHYESCNTVISKESIFKHSRLFVNRMVQAGEMSYFIAFLPTARVGEVVSRRCLNYIALYMNSP